VIPEVGVQLGYQFNPHVRAFVGYDFLYCSDVARPGQQIDRGVDTARIPSSVSVGAPAGPARPAFLFKNGDFWAQGVSFGLELRF